jgi:hypothetical protein
MIRKYDPNWLGQIVLRMFQNCYIAVTYLKQVNGIVCLERSHSPGNLDNRQDFLKVRFEKQSHRRERQERRENLKTLRTLRSPR